MFEINTNPEYQFGTTLKCLVKMLPRDVRHNLTYWQLVENLLVVSNDSKPVEAYWSELFESLKTEISIGEDTFAHFNQEISTKSRSRSSEYFTPRALTELVAKRTAERLYYLDSVKPQDYYTILEPSCGTGGMLFSLVRYVYLTRPDFIPKLQFIVNDLSIANVNATTLNFELHLAKGIELRPLISHCGDAHDLLLKYESQIHAVIGNPPFHKVSTSSIDPRCAGRLMTCYSNTEEAFILNGELPYIHKAKASKLSALCELPETIQELAIRLLCPFGFTAFYLPSSILSNSKSRPLRRLLLEGSVNSNSISLLGVTEFPPETFLHSGTRVGVSLVETMVGESLHKTNDGVMMCQVKSIGWDSRQRQKESDLPKIEAVNDAILGSYKMRLRRGIMSQQPIKDILNNAA
ncbi:N-6 DNA methylase [Candidatus Enterovibrio escicola]|uniref:N-6 DNA methylase n=1 Tax=Candidatus Enterovibrio escicola TaxID=1927127 RepID=UPI001237CE3D|nr:N-6 DNA methylase [Candidatus Enterovibrio escacola]